MSNKANVGLLVDNALTKNITEHAAQRVEDATADGHWAEIFNNFIEQGWSAPSSLPKNVRNFVLNELWLKMPSRHER